MTVLLETASPGADVAREALARFAELEKAPEHVHTYRITPLSLWNAAVAGVDADDVTSLLASHTKYPVADVVYQEIEDLMSRYGRLWLIRDSGDLVLACDDPDLLTEVANDKAVASLLGRRLSDNGFHVRDGDRGVLKQVLLSVGWPVADEAGYEEGAALERCQFLAELRPYQVDALEAWWREGTTLGGSGVVALPCGAGKTVVALAALVQAGTQTLVVCTTVSAIRQWIRETVEKTSLTEDDVGEWSGLRKQIRPVTFVTYHSLTWADRDVDPDADIEVRHPNLAIFGAQDWGLIVYDEVHLLPAPVFRATARIQAVRRLGLTATLVREDHREGDIFSLIGPKRYDAPWNELEGQGWIAPATCTEIRVPMSPECRSEYSAAEPKQRHRIAATSSSKVEVAEQLVARHPDEQILIIGQFVEQLAEIAEHLDVPLLTGRTAQTKRDRLFGELRSGELKVLVVSKVANFSIDLPDVSVAIQVSGQYGSRQEEAQRLGRILRPKVDGGQAHFYTLVSAGSDETGFARKRQRFLAEQGYAYSIVEWENS
ncbi:MAG: DEAD/DEAH box helicase [Actinomycetia bacterium]|nr:DEAD/DEAH box helicase [Actinomycetes bacterium]MCP4962526.1 DEAD/DEAH box helicase [Actinomycetes bacterium]